MKRSVWLLPTARDAPALQALVDRCTSRLGAPSFAPHVTICTQPAVPTLTDAAWSGALPLTLELCAVDFGDDYFHGCYLVARDAAAVRALQARCASTLNATVPERYPPHLSLAYGVLSPEQRGAASSLITGLPLVVTFERVELWVTDGPVPSWHKLV